MFVPVVSRASRLPERPNCTWNIKQRAEESEGGIEEPRWA